MAAESCTAASAWLPVSQYHSAQEWAGPDGGTYTFEALTDKSAHKDVTELAKHTYDGHDFISVLFPVWLARPVSWMCGIRYSLAQVLPSEGQTTQATQAAEKPRAEGVIAFMLLDMLDTGSTGWLEALRVHPDHRNQGLARKISALVNWQARQRAGCERIRYTTTTRNTASLKIASGLGMQEAQRWLFIAESLTDASSSFLTSLQRRAQRRAEESESDEDQALLQDIIKPCTSVEAAERLASVAKQHPVLLHDWVARNNTADTIRELQELDARFFYSTQDGSVSWCTSRAVYSGDMLHLVGLAAPNAASTAAHIAKHNELAQQEARHSLWVFASATHQEQLKAWGLCGIGGVSKVPQASPICVMVQADFGAESSE